MKADDLGFASAATIATRIAQGELSARAVTESFLKRIQQFATPLNCFTQIISDSALTQAADLDEAVRAGRPVGPLAGVPFAVKDIADVEDVATTGGAHRSFHRVASRDAPLIAKLRQAGAIFIGKTNLHEWAYGVTNINPHYGPVRNPWDRTRIPGGSSGGSAAAVAAGLCTAALGTDTGGSIRIPASLCGVVGIKPTTGLVSLDGVIPLSWTLDHAGPLARSIEDATLLLDVMAGTLHLGQLHAGLFRSSRVRVGIPRAFFWEHLDGDIETITGEAVTILRSLGADVVEVEVPYAAEAGRVAAVIMSVEATAYHERQLRSDPDRYGDDVRTRLERGFFLSGTDYVASLRARQFLMREFLRAFERADVLVMPTTQSAAGTIDENPSSRAATSLAMSVEFTRFTNPFNVTGFPALSMPCGFTRAGLPVGLQIVGPPEGEATVLAVGELYEQNAGWSSRRPPDA